MEKAIMILSLRLKLSDISNDYPVIEIGKFASSKYSGVLSSTNPTLKMSPGIIEVKQNWIDSIIQNYKAGALETLPFIDEEHNRGISLGPITDIYTKDGTLFVRVDWNERGKDYIKNNEYMYLSMDVDSHTISKDMGIFKMGQNIYPVLYGAAVCNDPVYKNQKTLQQTTQFSEKGKPTGNKILIFSEDKNKGGNTMFKEMITKLIEAIKAAMAGPDAEAAKSEVQGIISEISQAAGIEPIQAKDIKASEKKIKELESEVSALKAEKVTLSEKLKVSGKEENEQITALSTRLTESEKRNQTLSEKICSIEFDTKYLHKKVTPATRDKYFKIFMSDRDTAESILNDLADIKMGDDEKGQSGDNKLENGGMVILETQFAEEAKKIQSRDKLSFKDAYEKCKVEKADLWNKLTEGGK